MSFWAPSSLIVRAGLAVEFVAQVLDLERPRPPCQIDPHARRIKVVQGQAEILGGLQAHHPTAAQI